MGVQTLPVPVIVLPTRRTVVFTSSTTWTVPSSCIYADVMVVGGGQGGRGGYRAIDMGYGGGTGGAITIAQNLYLGGTGTVAITIGAGTSGTAGVAITSPTNPSAAGQSLFGTLIASQGGYEPGSPATPGYRGSYVGGNPYQSGDTNLANFTPILMQAAGSASPIALAPYNGSSGSINWNSSPNFGYSTDAQYWGFNSGHSGAGGSAGGSPGGFFHNNNNRQGTQNLNRLPWGAHLLLTFGAATAGTASGGAGGVAGLAGYSGGGGPGGSTASGAGGAGGPGAGGGGGNAASGGTGGNGGNAGTNTGSGGGGGGGSGSTSSGTGGAGGNGAAGFIIVSYLGTN
jgi:hypothetical protein